MNTAFADQVYAFLKTIPQGKVVTYGQIAAALGHPGAARAVGSILHVNPDPIGAPCYKVVNSQGRLAEHFGDGGPEIQLARLKADGVPVQNLRVDLTRYQWHPENEAKN